MGSSSSSITNTTNTSDGYNPVARRDVSSLEYGKRTFDIPALALLTQCLHEVKGVHITNVIGVKQVITETTVTLKDVIQYARNIFALLTELQTAVKHLGLKLTVEMKRKLKLLDVMKKRIQVSEANTRKSKTLQGLGHIEKSDLEDIYLLTDQIDTDIRPSRAEKDNNNKNESILRLEIQLQDLHNQQIELQKLITETQDVLQQCQHGNLSEASINNLQSLVDKFSEVEKHITSLETYKEQLEIEERKQQDEERKRREEKERKRREEERRRREEDRRRKEEERKLREEERKRRNDKQTIMDEKNRKKAKENRRIEENERRIVEDKRKRDEEQKAMELDKLRKQQEEDQERQRVEEERRISEEERKKQIERDKATDELNMKLIKKEKPDWYKPHNISTFKYEINHDEVDDNNHYHKNIGCLVSTKKNTISMSDIQCYVEDVKDSDVEATIRTDSILKKGDQLSSKKIRLTPSLPITEKIHARVFIPHEDVDDMHEASIMGCVDGGKWENQVLVYPKPHDDNEDVNLVGAEISFKKEVSFVAVAQKTKYKKAKNILTEDQMRLGRDDWKS